jgi:hypothetical protein
MIQSRRRTTTLLFAITIALLFLGATFQREFGTYSRHDVDFDVYYFTAAALRDQPTADIYYGALDSNPAARNAGEGSPIFEKARAAGPYGDVMLYLYPPLTADLLIPLARLAPAKAAAVWRFINLWLVFFSVVVISRMIGLRVRSAKFFLFLVTAFCFFPIVEGIMVGQVVLLILALWAISVAGYSRGAMVLSGCALGLASVLKVTPLMAVPLFFLWGERKWLASYFGTIAALIVGMGLFNGWHMVDVAAKVLAAMGGGAPILNNKCISAVLEWIAYGRFFSDITASPPLSHGLAMLTKAVCLAFYAACLYLAWRRGRTLNVQGRTMIFAMFALVSVLCSPIAWRHAYTVALVPFALLWVEALWAEGLGRPAARGRTWLLTVASVAMGTLGLDLVAGVPMPWGLRILSGAIWPISGVALCLNVLGWGSATDSLTEEDGAGRDEVLVVEPVAS